MWTNPGEIPGNGINNNKNGYIDDIHGWNFIGGKDGRNVSHDSYELAREYKRLKAKYGNSNGSGVDKKEYAYWLEVKTALEDRRSELETQKANIEGQFTKIEDAFATAKKILGKTEVTADDLEALKNGNDEAKETAKTLDRIFSQGMTEADLMEQKSEATKYFSSSLDFGLNPDYDPRSIVGDNYADLTNRFYGNNDYQGPDAFHGTHVKVSLLLPATMASASTALPTM